MKILVCGGAGYIGSHMVRDLIRAGLTPVVFDNLATGSARAVAAAAEGFGPPPLLVEGDLLDQKALETLFSQHCFAGVMHFAAKSLVGESMIAPGLYYRAIVTGTLNLLEAMQAAGVDKLIFSSTAAVYGMPEQMPITEHCLAAPINPYGQAKRVVELILEDYARAHGLKSVALRYFNAAGADPEGGLSENHEPETHLIPNVLKAVLGSAPPVTLFGADYPTPDGTCVRDYVHVSDLCQAHLLALNYLKDRAEPLHRAFNLGSGQGFSVLEVVKTAEKVTGRPVPHSFGPRRPGDPPVLVAAAEKAALELGWQPRLTALEDIIGTAWRAMPGRAGQ